MKKIFILLSIVAFFACNEEKTQEQIFETNVKACMQPLLQKNVDSLLADSACVDV